MDQLELCDLRIGHASHCVAEGLNAKVPAGGVTLLVGRNGSGKTTLLHSMGGLISPRSGEIRFGEQSLFECSPQARARQVALMLTTRPAVGSLTVKDVLMTARLPHRGIATAQQDRAAIAQAAQRCGIEALMARPLYSLSDGQTQWVMLARALAQATPLLLLDEPTAHLDPPNKRALFALLFAVAQEEKRTIVVSTHDLLPIAQQASAWWFLHEGLLHCGTPQDEALRRRIGDVLETTV